MRSLTKRGKKESIPGNCAEKKENPVKLHQLKVILLLAAFPAISHPQDKPAAPPAATPPAFQTKTTPTPPPAERKKPKKVWTNDDISSVKGDVSVVGEQNNSDDAADTTRSYQAYRNINLHQRQVAVYRDQIQQLQGQIEATDKRISQLRNFKGENPSPSGGINPARGYNMVPLEDQWKQLEERKKQLQAKIQDIENDAKKNGIEPGELR